MICRRVLLALMTGVAVRAVVGGTLDFVNLVKPIDWTLTPVDFMRR